MDGNVTKSGMVGLVTQHLTFADVIDDGFPAQLAEKVITRLFEGKKPKDVEFIRKGYTSQRYEADLDARTVTSYISTKVMDRDQEVMLPKGCFRAHFEENPVVLWCHDYRSLPLGKARWVRTDKLGLIAQTVFARHQFASEVLDLYIGTPEDGPFMRAWSVGFVPLEYHKPDEKETKRLLQDMQSILPLPVSVDDMPDGETPIQRVYDKWLLLEYSAVPVPSNPLALTVLVSKGLDAGAGRVIRITNPDLLKALDITPKEEVPTVEGTTETNPVVEQTEGDKTAVPEPTPTPVPEDKTEDPVGADEVVPPEDHIDPLEGEPVSDEEVRLLSVCTLGTEDSAMDHESGKPYPNEHACRLRNPDDFQSGSFRRVNREHDGKVYSVIMGKLQGSDSMTEQAYRYKKDKWSSEQAGAHCKSHGGSFEAASGRSAEPEKPPVVDSPVVPQTEERDAKEVIETLIANMREMGFDRAVPGYVMKAAEDILAQLDQWSFAVEEFRTVVVTFLNSVDQKSEEGTPEKATQEEVVPPPETTKTPESAGSILRIVGGQHAQPVIRLVSGGETVGLDADQLVRLVREEMTKVVQDRIDRVLGK